MNYAEITKIAKKALEDFSLKSQSIELIAQNLTTVYKVTDDKNERYALRLHISKNNMKDDKISITSELEWVSAIAFDTDIAVPIPYRNISGEYVTEVDGICCSLIKWIDGENKFDAETCKLLTEVMAKLHKHSSNWTLPKGFKRPQFDENDVLNIFLPLDIIKNDLINKESIFILRKAAKKAESIINSIKKNNATWGLIHNDLQPQNLIYYDGKIYPIDFGACGFGFYLSDICYAFHYIPVWYRATFFDEYMKHMPLPDNYIYLAEALYIAGHIIGLAFSLGMAVDLSETLLDYINNVANKEAIHFLNDKPFLLETAFFM